MSIKITASAHSELKITKISPSFYLVKSIHIIFKYLYSLSKGNPSLPFFAADYKFYQVRQSSKTNSDSRNVCKNNTSIAFAFKIINTSWKIVWPFSAALRPLRIERPFVERILTFSRRCSLSGSLYYESTQFG